MERKKKRFTIKIGELFSHLLIILQIKYLAIVKVKTILEMTIYLNII
jgi:hypothetical protein